MFTCRARLISISAKAVSRGVSRRGVIVLLDYAVTHSQTGARFFPTPLRSAEAYRHRATDFALHVLIAHAHSLGVRPALTRAADWAKAPRGVSGEKRG